MRMQYSLKISPSLCANGTTPTISSYFSFANETFIDIPDGLQFDHAFECTGGNGSQDAINTIIKHINPQGTVILMGVSEKHIPINTRDILEKGLTFIGSSRSGFDDFKKAVSILENEKFNKRIRNIVSVGKGVTCISDIHSSFEKTLSIPFKFAFKWNM